MSKNAAEEKLYYYITRLNAPWTMSGDALVGPNKFKPQMKLVRPYFPDLFNKTP